jgi:hypothetical protein
VGLRGINYTPKRVIRSVGSKPLRWFDPSRRIVYSHPPNSISCALNDYSISEEDFLKCRVDRGG